MAEFKKGISDAFLRALGRQTEKQSWWRDVLQDRDLIIAVRNEYLNVYWQGQSIFKVTFDGESVQASTHAKYLLDPALSDQVALDGATGRFGEPPQKALISTYEGSATLTKLKTAAGLFSGGEKQGVHHIARNNPALIDVETTFDANHLTTRKNLPRIDIAAVEKVAGGYELVFWEAKLFANKELRAKGDSVAPPVLEQLEQYKLVLDHYRAQVVAGYKRVAENLRAIADMSAGARPLGDHIRAVAEGAPLSLGEPPCVGLVVYGFDADQRDGDHWAAHANKLRTVLGNRLLLRGEARGFALP